MSRSMSWLRSTGSSLGRGSQCLSQRNAATPARRASAAAIAQPGRIAKMQEAQISRLFGRPFSTHKPANDNGRTSRFKRSEASMTEPAARADGEDTPAEPTPAQSVSSEPVGPSNSTTTSQPVASSSPRFQGPFNSNSNPQSPLKARKPIDTSSKEYKEVASKYVRFVVGLPFLIVTSYFLYERR
ncbi:hypothetical protein B0I37DRAFT_375261, partial [Chaetomium sp. MPI-CAGE-AT-0009]